MEGLEFLMETHELIRRINILSYKVDVARNLGARNRMTTEIERLELLLKEKKRETVFGSNRRGGNSLGSNLRVYTGSNGESRTSAIQTDQSDKLPGGDRMPQRSCAIQV